MIRIAHRLATACLLAVAGCGTPALCHVGPETVAPGTSFDSLERAVFERLMLARAGEQADPATSCVRTSTRLPELPRACVERETVGEELPLGAVDQDALVLEPTDGNYWLAFLPVRRYARGLLEGPVGVVMRDGNQVQVRALGVLRTFPERIGLRLEHVGEHVLLFADGELCDGGTCARATRLLLLSGQRLEPLHVATATQSCLGPAVFIRQEMRTIPVSARVEHVYQRTQGIDVGSAGLRVTEEIAVTERGTGGPDRVVRRSDASITLAVDAARSRLMADGTSRWSTLLLDASSLGRAE